MPIKIYKQFLTTQLLFPEVKIIPQEYSSITELKNSFSIQTKGYSALVRVSKALILYSEEYEQVMGNLHKTHQCLGNTGGNIYQNNSNAYEMGVILSVNQDHPAFFFTSQGGLITEVGKPLINPWQCRKEAQVFLSLHGSEGKNKNGVKVYDLFHEDHWVDQAIFSRYNSCTNTQRHWAGKRMEIMPANIDRIVRVNNDFFKRLNNDLRLLNKLVVGCTDSNYYIPEEKLEMYLSNALTPLAKTELAKFQGKMFRRVSAVVSQRGEILLVDTQGTQIVKSVGKLNLKDAGSYRKVLGLARFKPTRTLKNEKLIKGSLV